MSQHAPEVPHAAVATEVGAFGIVPENGLFCMPGQTPRVRPTQSDRDRTRFVTGAGRYCADIAEPEALHLAFVRSPHAHARIVSVDTSVAASMPGVVRIVTGADCVAAGLRPFRALMRYQQPDGSGLTIPPRPVLAGDRVRHVGEPVACVAATSPAAALDAAEAVMVEYESLPAVASVAAALADGAPLVHDIAPGNRAFLHEAGDAAATEAVFAAAAHVVSVESVLPRLSPAPMEPRGIIARFDAETGAYHLTTPHQGINELRGDIVAVFDLIPERVRINMPDVGGAFGSRSNLYPEQAAAMLAARLTGRTVRWTATRSEGFLVDQAGRGTSLRGRLAIDADGRFTAIAVEYDSDLGAWITNVGAHIGVHNPLQTLTGTYLIPTFSARFRVVFTNMSPTGPYRGAGRPDIALLVERLVDRAAAETGRDPMALRALNAIPRTFFPYTAPTGATYDSGDFAGLVTAAREAADWDEFVARAAESAARGRLRGRGTALFTEIAGGGGTDRDESRVTLRLRRDGAPEAIIETVTAASGQSQAETYAMIAAARLGLAPADCTLVASAADTTLAGAGSIASRSTQGNGAAVHLAAEAVRAALLRPAALRANCAPEDLDVIDGRIVRRADGHTVDSVAGVLCGLDGAVDAVGTQPSRMTFPSGCHVAEVEIDPETGTLDLVRYVAVDDAGTIINHTAANGQIHGGIAQGFGGVLGEALRFDETGQLVTASFMDYTMPRAADLPTLTVLDRPVPSPNNPIGAKGLGEAGTTGALSATANAVADALARVGATMPSLPATPHAIWGALRRAGRA
jgi:aerobic carbon-monoxide dehydrogenase large subunit